RWPRQWAKSHPGRARQTHPPPSEYGCGAIRAAPPSTVGRWMGRRLRSTAGPRWCLRTPYNWGRPDSAQTRAPPQWAALWGAGQACRAAPGYW
nr:hypothetical protein [Tanacetum cinerariifolium]